MTQPSTKIAVVSEIMKILEITPEEIKKINEDFKKVVDVDNQSTADMIKACSVYDPASFICGAIVGTSVMEMADGIVKEKVMADSRLSTHDMEVV